MEFRHSLKNANVSLKKVRMFLPELRNIRPTVAVKVLASMPHSAARVLHDVIKSAISGGISTLKVGEDMLEFREIRADQGMVLKRYRAGSRGVAAPILRRRTHITVVLGVAGPGASVSKKRVAIKKDAEDKARRLREKRDVGRKYNEGDTTNIS
jgi:large subunit ribosomal protein L22